MDLFLEGTDAFLVDVTIKPGNAIRVHADTPEGISVDRCAAISRYLNGKLDRDTEDYSLEVSSPGIGAPFKVMQQYRKNIGRSIEVNCNDGRKATGKLVSVDKNGIVLDAGHNPEEFGFEEIKTAKAIISFK